MKITVYQMQDRHDFKFMGFDYIVKQQDGNTLMDHSIYKEVYSGEVNATNLNEVYSLLNFNHPKDFTGHSLSVSDIVRTPSGLFFVDSFGFKQIEFAKQKA